VAMGMGTVCASESVVAVVVYFFNHSSGPILYLNIVLHGQMASIVSSVTRGIVAVTSCKGGVGKSTVSLELALRLAARGHRVGLYDADIHGPSLPTQFPSVSNQSIKLSECGYWVEPIMHEGISLMSFGWFSKLWGQRRRKHNDKSKLEDDDVTLRGNTIGLLAVQLLHTTLWGNLDFLIVDTPPGTGDIPQMIASKVPLSGAVVVTTPCNLAAVDVLKGVRMLERCHVPILAVVENMSSFKCGKCDEVHYPFGRGQIDIIMGGIRDPYNSVASVSLPIVPNADFGKASRGSKRTDNDPLSSEFAVLTEAIERQCPVPVPITNDKTAKSKNKTPVILPHELGFNELPHWPMEMEVHGLALLK
jgi:Mrp family chromosome partitioning ATPase